MLAYLGVEVDRQVANKLDRETYCCDGLCLVAAFRVIG